MPQEALAEVSKRLGGMYEEFKTCMRRHAIPKKHVLTVGDDDVQVHVSFVPAGHDGNIFSIKVPDDKCITIRGDVNPPAYSFVLSIKDGSNRHLSDETTINIYKKDEMGKRTDFYRLPYGELCRLSIFPRNIHIPARNILGIDIINSDCETDPAHCNLMMSVDLWTFGVPSTTYQDPKADNLFQKIQRLLKVKP